MSVGFFFLCTTGPSGIRVRGHPWVVPLYTVAGGKRFVVFAVLLCHLLVHRSFIVDNFNGNFASWAAAPYWDKKGCDYVCLIGEYQVLPTDDVILFENNGQLSAAYDGHSRLTIKERLPLAPGEGILY
jgi:hypothetical protein